MKRMYFKLTAVSAAVMAAVGTAYVVAEPAIELQPGDTITVTGLAPVDVLDDCTVVDAGLGQVTCPSLRAAVIYANNNGNQATKYDRIVLENGSIHTLTIGRELAEAIDEFDPAVGDLDITTPMNIETADPAGEKATIAGYVDPAGEAPGFGDRLLHIINAQVELNNLVLTKGQGVFMNGGAIYLADAPAALTIKNSVVTDNFASWDGDEGDLETGEDAADKGTTEVQGSGGGIYSKGTLNVSMSTLSKNTAETFDTNTVVKFGNGGAIYASYDTVIVDSTVGGEGVGNVAINGGGIQMAGGRSLTIERSTFSHNEAVSGGAMNVVSPSVVPFTIINSTVSSNHVTDAGAGINTNASVSIRNTTIANNVKDSSTKGSGLNQFSGVATLQNTLLANNTAFDSQGNVISANCGKAGTAASSVSSSGGNLSTDGSCALTDPTTDQVGVNDAKIGPLALNDNTLNGNLTHALLDGSPAIDKGTSSNCPDMDERGVVRPQAGLVQDVKVCDVGAFELVVDFPAPSDGDDGGGCTIGGDGRFDPTLPALAAAGLVFFGLRRFKGSK